MSKYSGVLLFDVADAPIPCSKGQWEENIGYRGVIDCWHNKELGMTLWITDFDPEDLPVDGPLSYEVWYEHGKSFCDTIEFTETYEEAISIAKKWMKEQ